jgi:hypothetical protein
MLQKKEKEIFIMRKFLCYIGIHKYQYSLIRKYVITKEVYSEGFCKYCGKKKLKFYDL